MPLNPCGNNESKAWQLVDSASFPGHTVDGAAVEPGAAPVMAFDQDRLC